MLHAYDVMTRSVATADPKTPVSQVATMMRDMNIGDILVVEEGKLRGIVTDRDLTIHVLTNGANSSAPVEKYMSTDVVTGSPDWSLDHVAQVMGDHQVRRLPIIENDNVVGIVSLGDVAVHTAKRETVANSLKNISDVTRTRFNQASPLTKFIGILVPIGVGAAVLLFANSKSGKEVRKQLQESDLADQARAVINDAVAMLQDPQTRQAAIQALQATGLPDKARQVIQDNLHVIQDSQKRISDSTSERVMQFADDTRKRGQDTSDRVMQFADDTRKRGEDTSDRVMQFADDTRKQARHFAEDTRKQAQQFANDTRKQAQHLPETVTKRFQKPKHKRFLFA